MMPASEEDEHRILLDAIAFLTQRHALSIVWLLLRRSPRRFNDIKRALGVSPVTLTQRLTELENAGILDRRSYPETPPRVEYGITAKGRALRPMLTKLEEWNRIHFAPPDGASTKP